MKTALIIGDPIENSLSPKMHNAAYQFLKIENKFHFKPLRVSKEELEQAIIDIRKTDIIGISVTMPHKQSIIPILDDLDESAAKIGAVNTIIPRNGKLIGYNTDWLGVLKPLEEKIKLENLKIALVGAGGAARAACYALKNSNAKVTIFNRSISKAQSLSSDFAFAAEPLQNLAKSSGFKIIINASSLGMQNHDPFPTLPNSWFNKDMLIFDMVYKPRETDLIKAGRNAGADIIEGLEMLLYQGMQQFELYTGLKAPKDIMKKALYEN